MVINVIDSVDNKKIKNLRKLKDKKYRDKKKLYLVEGEHLVLEAYKNNVLKEVLLYDFDIDLDVKKTNVSLQVMKSLSDLTTPNKIIGVCEIKENTSIDYNRVLILDNVQDPSNLGAIIRSMVAFNFDTLIISNDSVDIYNSKVLRAAQGMIYSVNVYRKDIASEIRKLKNNNYKIYGTNVRNGISIKNVKKTDKYAIIMGNEGNGISDEIEKLCDKNIYIDINNNCESLNVSVAASIILYELNR